MTALWRKQILPFGTIRYRNLVLDFTPAYLGHIATAFVGGALDMVPFAAERSGGGFSYDPELNRGEVRSLDVTGDGMDALIAVNAETDAQLTDDPDIPTGVRIIEHYKTTSGRQFPVVLASVYITRAPVLTGLRPWTRESD